MDAPPFWNRPTELILPFCVANPFLPQKTICTSELPNGPTIKESVLSPMGANRDFMRERVYWLKDG